MTLSALGVAVDWRGCDLGSVFSRSVVAIARRRLSPPDPALTDGEIVLRARQESDMEVIAVASHDPETMRRLDDPPLSPESRQQSVARAAAQWSSGRSAPSLIADAYDNRPLGLLNLQFGDDEEVASLAVSVFPEARGRGVAAKALRLGALWGLHELGLMRVAAEAATDNHSSIRAIEKAGFQREGILRAHCKTHGERHDCVMFSLVAADV
jgi:RimJ/RimL family protein N-acetyltransferase